MGTKTFALFERKSNRPNKPHIGQPGLFKFKTTQLTVRSIGHNIYISDLYLTGNTASPITRTKELILLREMIILYSDIYTKRTNTLRGQNVEFWMTKQMVHILSTVL
jgi:hypothetical protein